MIRSLRRAARAGVLPAALALVLAACGGGTTPTLTPATPLPSGAVMVEAKEYTFTPSALTLPAGTATFVVRNGGNEAHEFKVLAGETQVGWIESFPAGTTKDLQVTLAAGSYQLICTLNGHDQLGMKGTLTVTGG